MIHVPLVLATLLLVPSVSVSTSVVAEAEWDGEFEAPATCDSETGDCITGYTSLLQESMHIHRHTGRAHKGVRSTASWAWVNKKSQGGQEKTSASSGPDTKWMLVAGVVFAVLFYLFILRPALGPPEGTPRDFVVFGEEEEHKRIHDPLGEDTYSLAIAILVRDLRSIAIGEAKPGLKMSRISFAIGLVFLTIGIQISVVVCTKQFVTPHQVADIRDAYDNFEKVMYNGHTYLNAAGKARGIDGYFNASAFGDLEDDARESACNIPLSQLTFLFLILFVWSITCVSQLRQNIEMFMTLIYYAPTKDKMEDCLTHWEDAIDTDDEKDKPAKTEPRQNAAPCVPVQVIVGLTLRVKAFLVMCVFLPEFLTTSYILWLGSRWLTATNDFGNIVCNAVALEFILQLKFLLFFAFASERSKRDLAFTGTKPAWRTEHAGFLTYFITLVWLLLAFAWVYLYIYYLQHVLIDYKWDVHTVCNDWLIHILKASGGDDGN